MLEEALRAIPGVGELTARRLVERWQTVERFVAAPPETVAEMPGLSAERAALMLDTVRRRYAATRRDRRLPAGYRGGMPDTLAGRDPAVPPAAAVPVDPDGPVRDRYTLTAAAAAAGLDRAAASRLTRRWTGREHVVPPVAELALHAVTDPEAAARLAASWSGRAVDGAPWAATVAALDPVADRGASRPSVRCLVCRNPVTEHRQTWPLCPAHLHPPPRPGRRHGLARAIDGCRCQTCLGKLLEAALLVDARVQGVPLAALAAMHERTRQWVQQSAALVAPWEPWAAVVTVERAERDAVRDTARKAARPGRPCRCCGGPLYGRSRVVCSDRCREVDAALRLHTDETVYLARRQLLAPDADEPTRDRAVFTVGSRAWAHAVAAVQAGWPVADDLHPAAAAQLWRWIDTHPDEDPYDHLDTTPWREQLDDRRWLRRRYVTDGWSLRRIAAEVGCSAPTVRRALLRHRIVTSPRPAVRFAELRDRDWLAARTAEGRCDRDIAELIGASTAGVQAARRRFGLAPGSVFRDDGDGSP